MQSRFFRWTVLCLLLAGVTATGCSSAGALGSPSGSAGASVSHSPGPTPTATADPTPERLADLEDIFNRISEDEDVLRDLRIVVVTSSIRSTAGVVLVGLSTERTDAEDLLRARYGEALAVEVVDPTGAFLELRGTIAVRVTDPEGDGVEAGIWLAPLFAELAMDAMGQQTDSDGRFRAENQLPGRWRVSVDAPGFAPASADVDLAPGAVARVRIELRR